MFNKDLKKQVKAEFIADKEKRRARKQELANLPAEERKAEKQKDKAAKKQAKKNRKAAIKAMPKAERKAAKKHDKYYRKLETRPRRYITNGILLVLLVVGIFAAAPFVGDISDLMAVELTSDTPEAQAALEHGEEIAEMISDEGIVLLKNDDNLLPLQDPKINVFGFQALNFRTGGGGSGGSDQTRSVSFYQGLENAGIAYNPDLYAFYTADESQLMEEKSTGVGQVIDMALGKEFPNEPAIDYLTTDVIQQSQVTGTMSSFIHIGHKWSGGNPELLQNVLRDEWGFVGIVTSDAVLGGFMDLNLAIRNGNDLMLAVIATPQERYFDEIYAEDPVGVTQAVRARTHNICYAILNFTDLVK